ncbi:MAG TPA: AMP-binding protein [Tepidisphaeraceae bacterium]|nr:AMP-binding protein [Tepidisphaeraceae bacterium]
MSADTALSVSLRTFSDVLAMRAAQSPDERAFIYLPTGDAEELSWTFGEVDRRARAIAAMLQERGLPGRRAVLLYPPGLEFVAAMLGCLCAGVIAVPAYPPRSPRSPANQRLFGILDDSQPDAVLTVFSERQTIQTVLGNREIACLTTDTINLSLADQVRPMHPPPSSLACLQYTSGSTASPRGVMLTHANLMHNSEAICQAFGHTRSSRGAVWLPPYHDMGLIGGVLQPLYAGFPVVLMPPAAFLQRPIRWLAAISRYHATTSGGPNFAYDLCSRTISEEEKRGLDLSSWDVAFNGAEPIDPATLDRFAAAFESCGFRREAFYPCYGLAEATLMVSGGPKGRGIVLGPTSPQQNGGEPIVSCGPTCLGTSIRIVDPHSGKPCPPGNVGEIWISGPGVAQGYWNQPEQSRLTFDAWEPGFPEGPFLRSGDLGLVQNGELFVTGRIKDLIIIRGVNHHPHDIERTVQASHPALQPGGGAAFSVQNDGAEELVIVHELSRSQRKIDAPEVFDAIQLALARGHGLAASHIVLLRPGQLPKTSSGKVQRFACREAFLAGQFEAIAHQQAPRPTSEVSPGLSGGPAALDAQHLEKWLTEQLASAIGTHPAEIDPAEPFARYGLDSVKAISIAAQIANHMGTDVPATLFWDYPTISSLARYLATQVLSAAK